MQRNLDRHRSLAARISSKLEEGNFRGAVRLASSEESFCSPDEESLRLLREKHPLPHPDTCLPPFQQSDGPILLDPEEITKAVFAFPSGSACGPDGIYPQILKDLVSPSLGEVAVTFTASLTRFVNLVLLGDVPMEARQFFFGANLIGLHKKGGGVRPIAIGCALRRLVSKCACAAVREELGSLLSPIQLGFGVPRGIEAAVHAAREYLSSLESGSLMFKLDFRNAFNTVRRDKMLQAVLEKVPSVFPLAHCAYSTHSYLYYGHKGVIIMSAEGVQQGDPLGPMLFCLAIHDLVSSISSEFVVFYLDDGTLGGPADCVLSDLVTIEERAKELGLKFNQTKSEVICKDDATRDSTLTSYPLIKVTDPSEAILLGSPIGSKSSIDESISSKIAALKVLGERITLLLAHDALCLLRSAFTLPKLLFLLRAAPCYQSQKVADFDKLQRALLESLCNISLDDHSWLQASLPINSGGLGIRSAVLLAPSAFLASAAGCESLSLAILPGRFSSVNALLSQEALSHWQSSVPSDTVDPPTGISATSQKAWDQPVIEGSFSTLLTNTTASPRGKARLLASQQKESGAWLSAPPVSSLGLRMSNATVRIAVSLRLGTPICAPHECTLCGSHIDESGVHGLSCRRSIGRAPRHSQLNTIIKDGLSSAHIPAILEPQGLSRTDGKRPDGLSITPWSNGRPLVWDATCWDTFAPSHILQAPVARVLWQTWRPRKNGGFMRKSAVPTFLCQWRWRPQVFSEKRL